MKEISILLLLPLFLNSAHAEAEDLSVLNPMIHWLEGVEAKQKPWTKVNLKNGNRCIRDWGDSQKEEYLGFMSELFSISKEMRAILIEAKDKTDEVNPFEITREIACVEKGVALERRAIREIEVTERALQALEAQGALLRDLRARFKGRFTDEAEKNYRRSLTCLAKHYYVEGVGAAADDSSTGFALARHSAETASSAIIDLRNEATSAREKLAKFQARCASRAGDEPPHVEEGLGTPSI